MKKLLSKIAFFSALMIISAVAAGEIPVEAQNFHAEIEGKTCIESFKKNMNDPSSFQLASPLQYDPIGTSVDANEGVDFGYRGIVVFEGKIREKNEYGGLVLEGLDCEYGIKPDGSLAFIRNWEMSHF